RCCRIESSHFESEFSRRSPLIASICRRRSLRLTRPLLHDRCLSECFLRSFYHRKRHGDRECGGRHCRSVFRLKMKSLALFLRLLAARSTPFFRAVFVCFALVLPSRLSRCSVG